MTDSVWGPRAVRQFGKASEHVVIAWTPPSTASPVVGYLVKDLHGQAAEFVDGDVTVALVEGLEPGKSYWFVVSALTDEGWSPTSPGTWIRTSGRQRRPRRHKLRSESDDLDMSDRYLSRIRQIPLLTPAEEQKLASEIIPGVFGAAYWKFVLANLRLVAHWARKLAWKVEDTVTELDDLIQAGTEGLFKAVDRFDENKGFKFSTFGSWWIRQAIDRDVANNARTIRVPVHLFDRLLVIRRESEDGPELADLTRAQREQLADLLALSLDELVQAISLLQPIESLEDIVAYTEELDRDYELNEDEDAAWRIRALETDPSFSKNQHRPRSLVGPRAHHFPDRRADDAFDAVLNRFVVETAVRTLLLQLPGREQKMIAMRYGIEDDDPKTLEEIGDHFSLTRERVRQLLERSLDYLSKSARDSIDDSLPEEEGPEK